ILYPHTRGRYPTGLGSSRERIGEDAVRLAGRTLLREFLHPQVGRPLCGIFALAGDTWPELVIAADLLHEELGATGVHLVAEASDPIRMHRRAPPPDSPPTMIQERIKRQTIANRNLQHQLQAA